MEFMPMDLRKALSEYLVLKDRGEQLRVLKEIASGMNFLHSLKPPILVNRIRKKTFLLTWFKLNKHRDLRTPNILINTDLVCKIGDFELAHNLGYGGITTKLLYGPLIPPECKNHYSKFTTHSDVYFFGWIIIELILSCEPDYNETDLKILESVLINEPNLHNLIKSCIHQVIS